MLSINEDIPTTNGFIGEPKSMLIYSIEHITIVIMKIPNTVRCL